MAQHGTDGSQLTIPALGRHAFLGYLYDERADQFLGVSVFKGLAKNTAIRTTHTPGTDFNASLINSNRDKFRLYKIKANIQANLLSGMVQVTGSAAYLQEEKKSANEIQGLMVYDSTTVLENLEIYYEELKDHYNTNVISQQGQGATHIVTEIKWGGRVAISFSQKADSNADQQKIAGHLDVSFEKAKGNLSIRARDSVTKDYKDNENISNFSVNVKGDIVLPKEVPSTPEQVQELIKQVPELIKSSNDGKGVPLEFKLTPLAPLRKHLKITVKENEFSKQIDESKLDGFISIFETITETAQRLNDHVAEFRNYPICVLSQQLTALKQLRAKFITAKIKFQGQMKETLIAVRSGIMQEKDVSDLVENYRENEFSPTNVEAQLKAYEGSMQKIRRYKILCKSYPNVEFFGNGSDLDTSLLSNIKDVIYILYQFPDNPTCNANELKKQNEHDLFFRVLNHPNNKLFYVDCEFDFSQKEGLTKTVIQQVVNGVTYINDVSLELKLQETSVPMELKALGRFAEMGQLYDARTDTFLRDTYLLENPESLINTTKNFGHIEVYDVPSESYEDKCRSLSVDSELQYSILGNMFPLIRSGQYLSLALQFGPEGKCPDNVKSIVHVRRLNEESISIKRGNLPDHVIAEAVCKSATHFVTKIEFGFTSIFSCRTLSEKSKVASNHLLQSSVSNLKKILKRIKITGDLDSNKRILSSEDVECLQEGMQIEVFSDIQGPRSTTDLLNSNQELVDYLNEVFLPQQTNMNNGRGIPIGYVLYPLANLATEIGVLLPHVKYENLSSQLPHPNEVMKIFQHVALVRNQIKKMSLLLENNIDFVTEQDFKVLKNIEAEFNCHFGNFENKFQKGIRLVKAGLHQVKSLEILINEYKPQKWFDNEGLYKKLGEMKEIEEKIQFCNEIKEDPNVVFIGRENSKFSFHKIFTMTASFDSTSTSSLVYILYYHPTWVKSQGDLWRENFAKLKKLRAGKEKEGVEVERARLFIINCEFSHESCKDVTKPEIHEYRNGKRTCTNAIEFLEEEKSNLHKKVVALEQLLQSKLKEELAFKTRMAKLEAIVGVKHESNSYSDDSERNTPVINGESEYVHLLKDIKWMREGINNLDSNTNKAQVLSKFLQNLDLDQQDLLENSLKDLPTIYTEANDLIAYIALNLVLSAMERYPTQREIQSHALDSLLKMIKNKQIAFSSFHSVVNYTGNLTLETLMKRTIISLLVRTVETFKEHVHILERCLFVLECFDMTKDAYFIYTKLISILLEMLEKIGGKNEITETVLKLMSLTIKTAGELQIKIAAELGAIPQILKVVELQIKDEMNDPAKKILELSWAIIYNLAEDQRGNCESFIVENGMGLFFRCLVSAENDIKLQNSMLDCLGTVSEITNLRSQLMNPEIISHFQKCLTSPEKENDVSMGAVAVRLLVEIASDGEEAWTVTNISRKRILEKIRSYLVEHEHLEGFDFYITLLPVLRLLKIDHTPVCQLWAAWTLSNLIRNKREYYVSMLEKENGYDLLRAVKTNDGEINFFINEVLNNVKC